MEKVKSSPESARSGRERTDGSYYAEGGLVWRAPKEIPSANGGRSFSLGFPICILHDACPDEGAEIIAQALNRLGSEDLGHGECHGLDTPERVCFYEQDFYVLSNFSSFSIWWNGVRFDTSEAVYHWEKFEGTQNIGPLIQNQILNAISAHEAFKIAELNRDHRRPNWDDIKLDVMLRILRTKAYQHEYVSRKLLATGNRELVENSWRDDFWGWGPNRDGQNMLGKLWMQVREELRRTSPHE